MQVINSRPFTIRKDIDTVFGIACKPEMARHFLDRVGDKPAFRDITIDGDSVHLKAPVLGEVTLRRNRVEQPSLVSYKVEGAPLPVELVFNLQPDEGHTKTQLSAEVDAPAFVSGMVSARLKPMMEKIADSLEQLDVDRFLGTK